MFLISSSSLIMPVYLCQLIQNNILSEMSLEKEVQIYTYTITILNLTLKVKFPCKIYLENQGKSITNEVQPANSSKFIFNQQVTLKNQTEKQHIELVVQLITEKGARYVGGVVKLVESELIGSEGECVAVSLSKCLDSQAYCEIRVDQVTTSRIKRKGSPKRKPPLRSQYNPDALHSIFRPGKNQQGETKSQFNFPLSMNRGKNIADNTKDRMMALNSMKKVMKGNQSLYLDRQPVNNSGGPLSTLQFEVYKEGYNKLKDKYRKQTEAARIEMNKRVALESSENNLKLEVMRYKLKAEELDKTVNEKAVKIKDMSETIATLQKKELDSKYLKQEIENKAYTIKSLEETIKSLHKDNNELKLMQNQRYQSEQEGYQSLKSEIERIKKEAEIRQSDLSRDLKSKNEKFSKLQYDLHNKSQELERVKCNIEDLDKNLSIKTFQWEKIMQSERTTFKTKQEELKEKIAVIQAQKVKQSERISILEQSLQQKKGEVTKLEYDRKVMNQNNQILIKQNQQLKLVKQKYVQLNRQYKILNDEKSQIEKVKQREAKNKDNQIDDLQERLKTFTDSNKKSVKDLEEKLKSNQLKLIESDSQNESLRSQLEKIKRQFEVATKQLGDVKSQLKEKIADIKAKEQKILNLTNQLTHSGNKTSQGEHSLRIEITRLKEEVERITRSYEQERAKAKEYSESIGLLELSANKHKMEFQFKEEKVLKELGYSKQKVASLESFKTDLEAQTISLTNTINNLKNHQKNSIEKTQRLQLEAIKSKEGVEKLKKQIKILQQKLQNNDINLKNRVKQNADMLILKEKLQKKLNEQESQLSALKNDVNKQASEKQRHQKIGQILQNDLAKAKTQQNNLLSIITDKEGVQSSLRQDLKKQKQDYTKLDMSLNQVKKQYEKFKESLVENLNTVFSSIPEGLNSTNRQYRSMVNQKSTVIRDNSQVLNLLITLGRQARSNTLRNIDQLKQAIRDNQKLNSDYSLSVNKRNTNQFEYNQNIANLQEEITVLLEQKTKQQNRYEEDIFLLEGRLKEKEVTITELTEQVQELDFIVRNMKTEFEIHREEAQKKEYNKNKLIEELRLNADEQHSENNNLASNLEHYQQALEASELELQSERQAIAKLNKDFLQTKQSLDLYEEQTSTLKKQLKRALEKIEELNMKLIYKDQQLTKSEDFLREEQRKAGQLRQFSKVLMKQKQQIIKCQMEKSQKLLELQTLIEELKHQIQSSETNLKKYKITQQEQRQVIKKLIKNIKDQQSAKLEEKSKGNKLNDRLKDRQKEVITKDQQISKLEDKLKKESEKKAKDIRQLEAELDQIHQKLLNYERQANDQIISLESKLQKQVSSNAKLSQTLSSIQQSLFRQKNRSQELKQKLQHSEKEFIESQQKIKELTSQAQALSQEIKLSQQQSYRLQGRINHLQMKFEMKQNDNSDKLQNLEDDWSSKYYSMEEQFDQRIVLVEKQRDFLKQKLTQSDRENKKLNADLKTQQSNINSLKKNFQEKVRLLEEDRLSAIGQKNIENQRLIDEVRITFENLKSKESELRKLSNQYELAKTNIIKMETKWKDNEQKIRNLNRTFLTQSEEFKKKEQSFKKIKQGIASSIWKSERQVRRLVQNSTRQIIDLADKQNTIKVMEISKSLEGSILAAISFKLEEKQT